MTTEMLKLEKLYAKGKLVWKDANEWDSSVIDASVINILESDNFLYCVYKSGSNVVASQLDKRTGNKNWGRDLGQAINDKIELKTYKDELYVVFTASNGVEFISVDYLSNIIAEKNIVSTNTSYNLWFSIDEERNIYLAYRDATKSTVQKYSFSATGIDLDLIWEIVTSGSPSVSFLFIYDNQLFVENINGQTGFAKVDKTDGSIIAISSDISPYKKQVVGFQDCLYIISGYTSLGKETTTIDRIKISNMENQSTRTYDGVASYDSATSSVDCFENGGRINLKLVSNFSKSSAVTFLNSYGNIGIENKNDYLVIPFSVAESLSKPTLKTIAKGSNDHIYFIDESQKIKKRKLYKNRLFNLKLEQEENMGNITRMKNNAPENSGGVI